MKKQKVLHIITGLNVGGAERALYNILRGGVRHSCETVVLSLRDDGLYGPLIRKLGVPVLSLDLAKQPLPNKKHLDFFRCIREHRPSIIQGWMEHGNLAATLASGFATPQPRLFWNIRQTLGGLQGKKWTTRQIIRINRSLSNKPDAIIFNSSRAIEEYATFGFNTTTATLIPNGFDTTAFTPCSREAERNGIQRSRKHEQITIGHVGRFAPMKNQVQLLRSVQNLMRQDRRIQVVMVGEGLDDRNTTITEEIDPDLRPRIFLHGRRSDVELFYPVFDFFVLSSVYGEGFPNVIGEAMASGVPCVATDVGDCSEIIADTGIVVEPNNQQSLQQAIKDMASLGVDKRAALGRKARERVRTHYDLKKVSEFYERLYSR